MRIETVLVTPKTAANWLQRNTRNRPLREGNVAELVADMKNGVYRLNPSPICFMTNGDLGDGQHRLKAIEVSGIPQTCVVAFDIEEEMRLHFDEGKRRSFRDNMLMCGRPYATQTTATINNIYRYAYGLKKWTNGNRPTNEQLQKIHNKIDVELTNEVFNFADRVFRVTRVPVGVASFLIWCGYHVQPEKTQAFFDKVISGENLVKGQPAFAYRELALRRNTKVLHSGYAILNAGIKCMVKYFEGSTISAGHASRAENEVFPTLTPEDVLLLIER